MHRTIGRLVVVGITAVVCQFPIASASAHGANGLSPSSEQTTITGVAPTTDAFSVRVIGFGDKIEVRRTSERTIAIPGYQNEPYLKIDDQGVWRNDNSPSRWSNEDRYGLTPLPETASVNAQPDWQNISDQQWTQWHDHRAHTMVDFELVETGAGTPQDQNVVQRFSLDVLVDEQIVVVTGEIQQLTPPSTLHNLVVLLGIGAACVALLVAVAKHPRASSVVAGLLGVTVLVVSLVHAWGAAVFAGDQLNQSTEVALWLSSYFAIPGWIALTVSSIRLIGSTTRPAGLAFGFGLLSTVAYGGLLDWSTLTNALTVNTLDPTTVQLLVVTTLGIGIPLAVQTLRTQWYQSRAALTARDQNAGSLQDTNDVAT
jgi:hypothetical protein